MVKVAVLGLAAVFLSLIAGSVKREYAVAVMIGTVLLLAIYSLSSIRMVIERIHEFEQAIGLSREYLGILLKMLGIAYLTQLCCQCFFLFFNNNRNQTHCIGINGVNRKCLHRAFGRRKGCFCRYLRRFPTTI